MDKRKAVCKQEFKKYVRNYDKKLTAISRKYIHSFKVAKLCEKIARNIFNNKEDVYAGFVIGLLHDIARFEQWTKFETFRDTNEYNHSKEGVKILFEKGLIKNFPIDEKYYDIIRFAIKNHGELKIDESERDERKILFAKLIRDADKLDIFDISMKKKILVFFGKFNCTELSSKVKKDFYLKKLIDAEECFSLIDRAVLHLAMVFDINFEKSKKIYIAKKYYLAAYKNFKNGLLKENIKKLLEMTDYVKSIK